MPPLYFAVEFDLSFYIRYVPLCSLVYSYQPLWFSKCGPSPPLFPATAHDLSYCLLRRFHYYTSSFFFLVIVRFLISITIAFSPCASLLRLRVLIFLVFILLPPSLLSEQDAGAGCCLSPNLTLRKILQLIGGSWFPDFKSPPTTIPLSRGYSERQS